LFEFWSGTQLQKPFDDTCTELLKIFFCRHLNFASFNLCFTWKSYTSGTVNLHFLIQTQDKPTAVIIRGLQEKTFRKNYIRRHLEKYGEIVRISSVVGQARSVMVRFAETKVCSKVYKIGSKDIKTLFPKFPKADIKIVKGRFNF
jgi:hypothetical protein